MKLFLSAQTKVCDAVTCENQNITEKDLIQRAGNAFVETLQNSGEDLSGKIIIFAGPGNNGADGISIAKNLYSKFHDVELVLIPISKQYSDAFKFYLDNPVDQQPFPVHIIKDAKQLNDIEDPDVFIDAVLGTGFNKETDKLLTSVINYINNGGKRIISVDIPSGISADNSLFTTAVKANKTITFEFPKLSFFDPKTHPYVGEWLVAPINLDENWKVTESTNYSWVTKADIKDILKTRDRFSHKGDFGHSLIISGSYGKIGAAVLAGKACLRMGCGLVTMHLPKCGYEIMQISVPEAIVDVDPHQYYVSEISLKDNFNAIAIGPGIGIQHHTERMFLEILESKPTIPMVLDADALNILAKEKDWLKQLPEGTILTPHPGEFNRLFGWEEDHLMNIENLIKLSIKYKIYIVLKGGYTTISTPEGNCYFNTTGNPGMATAGCGDALTGMIVSMLAQGYSRFEACVTGVYLHGLAGDLALQKAESQESMIATDLIASLGSAFKKMASS